jgi:hypothetical protein
MVIFDLRVSELSTRLRRRPNKALQLTVNPLRGLSAAELGRNAAVNGRARASVP